MCWLLLNSNWLSRMLESCCFYFISVWAAAAAETEHWKHWEVKKNAIISKRSLNTNGVIIMMMFWRALFQNTKSWWHSFCEWNRFWWSQTQMTCFLGVLFCSLARSPSNRTTLADLLSVLSSKTSISQKSEVPHLMEVRCKSVRLDGTPVFGDG